MFSIHSGGYLSCNLYHFLAHCDEKVEFRSLPSFSYLKVHISLLISQRKSDFLPNVPNFHLISFLAFTLWVHPGAYMLAHNCFTYQRQGSVILKSITVPGSINDRPLRNPAKSDIL